MPSGKTAVRGGDELVICRFPDGAARHLVTSHALGLKSKILTGDSHRSRKTCGFPAWGSAKDQPARRSSKWTGLWNDEDGAWVTTRFSGRRGLWGEPPVRDPRSRGSGRSGTGWWSWGPTRFARVLPGTGRNGSRPPFGSVAVHDGTLEESPPTARESGQRNQSYSLK